MKKDYYMHQQFLLNVDFKGISLEDYIYAGNPLLIFDYWEERNLFDQGKIERCISLSYILREFDNEAEWNKFLGYCSWIDKFIILVDGRISEENTTTLLFLTSTLKALVRRLLDFQKDVSLFFEPGILSGLV